ncbi:MAG: biosynthetic peptidoglycan transglycosylase [Acidobacteriota bacterium]|jgi:monofunctional biosynthetic peptidoglycan transglycosylase|nr:biosynthetic peptidoglycan transglycosylase [Acidobacteriota bacterium]
MARKQRNRSPGDDSGIKKSFIRRHPFLAAGFLVLGILLALSASLWLSLPEVESLAQRHPARTALMELRVRQAASGGKGYAIHQHWIAWEGFPLLLRQAVVASEDAAFYSHEGVDFFELKESFKQNLRKGEKARGGSTITMQLARNLFLSPHKSFLRKLREILIARRLEAVLSKRRILHLYLNIVELGRGVFGFPAAAQYFFGGPLEGLTPAQLLRLVAVLPKPLRVSPLSNSRYLNWRVRLVADRMVQRGHLTPEQRLRIESDL